MDNYLKSIDLDLSDCVEAAKQLLGYKIIYNSPEGLTEGYIVETEAYHMDDPASHSYAGLTKRNSSLFEPAGTIYVYFTYGMHYCLNIVTGKKGQGQAVLIRAIESTQGLDLMSKRRTYKINNINLTNGPAKLTKAFSINKSLDGTNIKDGPIKLVQGITPKKIITSKRVGITKAVNKPWRFYIKDNPFVSKIDKDRGL